jgi:AmmeMemoRadiSam system protein A
MLETTERESLGTIARQSIQTGLQTGRPLAPEPTRFPPTLLKPGASFVTLHKFSELRGCIGSLEAHRPLTVDVAENAFAAAFRDPRFTPLRAEEWELLTLDISVLSSPEPVSFDSQTHLLSLLRPGVDGLILQDGIRRGTFLPSVWEQLPEPAQFLAHLKQKAGLAPDHWSGTLKVWRYETESFPA